METHDGFTFEQWKELSRIAVEQGADHQRWFDECELSDAMRAHLCRLRNRATKKFSDPERWIWTSKLLEQSSDEKVARLTAAAFPTDVQVIDFCCGAGADSVALASRGAVTAVDHCEVACALTNANLTMHFPTRARATFSGADASDFHQRELEVLCAAAESIEIRSDTWVHLDPDRRTQSRRTTQANYFQPGLAFLLKVMDQSAGGSIKLAPATKCESPRPGLALSDSQAIAVNPTRMGRQFVAWGGSVRQQRWWWNVESYPAGSITVSIIDRMGEWYHWTVNDQEVSECDDWCNIVDDWQEIDGYIGDIDGSVRAAGLQGCLAEKFEAARIGNHHGYFVQHELPDINSPLIDWFKIHATMPFDRKRLRAYLRENNIGILEIKVRNLGIEPATLRKELKLQGSEAATILITRCGSKTFAIVGQRLTSTQAAQDTLSRS